MLTIDQKNAIANLKAQFETLNNSAKNSNPWIAKISQELDENAKKISDLKIIHTKNSELFKGRAKNFIDLVSEIADHFGLEIDVRNYDDNGNIRYILYITDVSVDLSSWKINININSNCKWDARNYYIVSDSLIISFDWHHDDVFSENDATENICKRISSYLKRKQ